MEPSFGNAEKINFVISDNVLKNFRFVLVYGDGRNRSDIKSCQIQVRILDRVGRNDNRSGTRVYLNITSKKKETSDEDGIGGSVYVKIWQDEGFRGENEGEW